jgi:hypothetical protein
VSTLGFIESVVEDAALAWLESLGYAINHVLEIAARDLFGERQDSSRVMVATTGASSCKKCTLLFKEPNGPAI